MIAAEMTPHAVELALEIRKEIEARYDEADRLRQRAVDALQIDAELAQRRFMLVDPGNRLVADTLVNGRQLLWPAHRKKERALRQDHHRVGRHPVRERRSTRRPARQSGEIRICQTTRRWRNCSPTLSRTPTLLLGYCPRESRIVRFKVGKTQTWATQSKIFCATVKTRPVVVDTVDSLLENHICAEIADILNAKGVRPGGSARRDRSRRCRLPISA